DEGEDNANSVLTLVIHHDPLHHQSTVAYDHYSLLATIEDSLGVDRLGAAVQATPMTDLIAAVPPAPLRTKTESTHSFQCAIESRHSRATAPSHAPTAG